MTNNRLIRAEIERITPAQAKELLAANRVNRRPRQGVVAAYRRDMEQGRWGMTGEPLQISRTGGLLNGQHRMLALAEAAVEWVEFMVVRGLADEAQTLMDQGATRGAVDALLLRHGHIKNRTVVASVARWMVAHPDPGVPGMIVNLKRKVSAAEIVAVYSDNPDIQEAADMAVSFKGHIPGSASAIAYAWLQLNRIDPIACNEFFGAIVDMAFSASGDPRKAALKRLQVLAGDSESRGDKTTSVAVISILTRAWNAWRKGEHVDQILARNSKGQIIEPVQPV